VKGIDKTPLIIAFLTVVVVIGISSHSSSQAVSAEPVSTPAATPFYAEGGPFFTYPLMCPKDIPLREGLSWRGITVGKSYLWDLEELYGVVATRVQIEYYAGSFADLYGITLTGKASIERRLARGFQACVVDWKVAALAIGLINDAQLSDYLEPWIIRFGAPEIISWSVGVGESWRYRTLIWPRQGLALYVDRGDLSPQGAFVTDVIFFPPAQSKEDLLGWPYSQLQTTPLIGLEGEYPGPLNPFDFAGMLATATARSLLTPTLASTLTPMR
jgi:hypothetical protein